MSAKKGWIRNESSKVKKSFLFNPSEFVYSRSAVYADITSPGMSYPSTQFVRGEMRSFSVSLFFHDKPYSGKITDYEDFLNAFLPPETVSNMYSPPPLMTFCFGDFIRKCFVESIEVSIQEWDRNLKPTVATIELSLRQVSL